VRPVELRAEVLVRVGGRLLEGPTWDAGRLRFVDILGRTVYELDWTSRELSGFDVEETTTAWIPWGGGGSALATRSGVRRAEAGVPPTPSTLVVPIETDLPGNRSNDAKCDPGGRLWVGTMADDETPAAGALYRVDRDLTCTRVLDPVTISNGLGWTADGRRMLFVDSPTRRIDALDFDPETGASRNRRPWADTSAFPGVPDGLAVDADDGVWVAIHDGSMVLRFDAEGRHAATVRVPTARPTSCTFAGPALDRLAITTAAAPDGTGGDVYVCEPGVVGTPTVPFAGTLGTP